MGLGHDPALTRVEHCRTRERRVQPEIGSGGAPCCAAYSVDMKPQSKPDPKCATTSVIPRRALLPAPRKTQERDW